MTPQSLVPTCLEQADGSPLLECLHLALTWRASQQAGASRLGCSLPWGGQGLSLEPQESPLSSPPASSRTSGGFLL